MLIDEDNSKVSPRYKSVNVGEESGNLSCHSDSSVMWFFERGKLPANAVHFKVSMKNSVLKIYNMQLYNFGTYQCFSWSSSTKKYYISKVNIVVYGKGVIMK